MNKFSKEFLDCKESAFYYINKKRYTKKELVDKLIKKEYEYSLALEVADYLEEAGYIDDFDFTRRYINDAVKIKKHGLVRIRRDLMLKGINQIVIDDVINTFEPDTVSVLKNLVESKAVNVNFDDEKQVNKLYGFLLRRGFKFNEIKDAFMEYRNKKENI